MILSRWLKVLWGNVVSDKVAGIVSYWISHPCPLLFWYNPCRVNEATLFSSFLSFFPVVWVLRLNVSHWWFCGKCHFMTLMVVIGYFTHALGNSFITLHEGMVSGRWFNSLCSSVSFFFFMFHLFFLCQGLFRFVFSFFVFSFVDRSFVAHLCFVLVILCWMVSKCYFFRCLQHCYTL